MFEYLVDNVKPVQVMRQKIQIPGGSVEETR